MSTTEIEKRLASLEHEVATLKATRHQLPKLRPIDVLESIHGTFEDDEAFRQAARFGRTWRNSQRPSARKSKAKRK